MKSLSSVFLIMEVVFPIKAYALDEGGIYRLKAITDVYDNYFDAKIQKKESSLAVGKSTRFKVEEDFGDVYRISLLTVYRIPCYALKTELGGSDDPVCESDESKLIKAVGGGLANHKVVLTDTKAVKGGIYYLPLTVKIEGSHKVTKIDKLAKSSEAGPVVGILLVPYKYRINSKSIEGETTIGMYLGYAVEPAWFNRITDTSVTFVPYFSAGLTNVDINTQAEDRSIDTNSEQGVTVAIGFLLKNWSSTNLGFVIGQDRIGDKSWEHEGKTWVSLSLGWVLN